MTGRRGKEEVQSILEDEPIDELIDKQATLPSRRSPVAAYCSKWRFTSSATTSLKRASPS